MDKLRKEVTKAMRIVADATEANLNNGNIFSAKDCAEQMADAAILAVLDGIRDMGPLVVDQEFQSYALVTWHKTIDTIRVQIMEKGNE